MSMFNLGKDDKKKTSKEEKLIEALRSLGVSNEHIDTVFRHQKVSQRPFIEVVRDIGFPESEVVAEAMSIAYNKDYVNPLEVISLVPQDFPEFDKLSVIASKSICPVGYNEETKTFRIAISESKQEVTVNSDFGLALRGYSVEPVFASQETIENTFLKVFSQTKKDVDVLLERVNRGENVETTEVIRKIVRHACFSGVSDIHFNPLEYTGMVKFRVDGDIVEFCALPKEYFERCINTIKRDGQINDEIEDTRESSYNPNDPEMDRYSFRVQLSKTVRGVAAIFRILDSQNNTASIDAIGFDDETKNKLIDLTEKSAGLVLITGPTGSGKTTTLYSLLKLIDPIKTAIHTVENPVEYRFGSWNQHEINRRDDEKDEGYKWQKFFKGLLRNDIDVGLLGEVRDKSTADAALQLSNTGHLVWTTLHTNSAGRAITRLSEMKVNMGAFADVALAIMAQRLVKKLCPHCKEKIEGEDREQTISEILSVLSESYPKMEEKEKDKWNKLIGFNFEESTDKKEELEKHDSLYIAKGCEHCMNTGYKGRKAVYELLPIDKTNRSQIAKGATGDEVMDKIPLTRRMWGVGIEAILSSETTLMELKRRVNKED